MVGMHGRDETVALQALQRGEVIEVKSPRSSEDGAEAPFPSVSMKGHIGEFKPSKMCVCSLT
eukprot:4726254-Alexandrium_andersonii.AAC.1